MTTRLRYTGTVPIWGTTVVGKPDRWYPGQIQSVSDSDAALYRAYGGFENVDQSPVSGGAAGTVPASQIIAGTLGSYTADTTYVTADTSGGVEKGTLVRWDTSMAAWVFDFYRSAKVL